jgi:hypothetical protein
MYVLLYGIYLKTPFVFVLELHRLAVDAHPSDGANLKTSKFALEVHVSLVIYGSLVIWLPPYKHFMRWMGATYWNPSSFPFVILVCYFP